MDNTAISLSDNAAKRIAYLLSQEEPDTVLRIAVDGGGCSGFKYSFEFENKAGEEASTDKTDDDIAIEKDGAIVLVDEVSAGFMKNAVVDYVETLGAAHFAIKNPNVSSSCGCGNSFAV